jgi:hypothetical protein
LAGKASCPVCELAIEYQGKPPTALPISTVQAVRFVWEVLNGDYDHS